MPAGKIFRPDSIFPPLALFALFLVFGALAIIGDETKGISGRTSIPDVASAKPAAASLKAAEEMESVDMPRPLLHGDPRWFRSNAGGMALEQLPSRLVALRNEYALVIDYASPDEMDPRLAPFFQDGFSIEIRVLFEGGRESKRQWIFLDEAETVRLNAVLADPEPGEYVTAGEESLQTGEVPVPEETSPQPEAVSNAGVTNGNTASGEDDTQDETGISAEAEVPSETDTTAEVSEPAKVQVPAVAATGSAPAGFIEIFNEDGQIASDIMFIEDGSEIVTEFSYNSNVLITAGVKSRKQGDPPGKFTGVHTDYFRYNRSLSLRYVERVFDESLGRESVRIAFPANVLEAASRDNFTKGAVLPGSQFMETFSDAGDGFTVKYETDSRGRTLRQTMLDEKGNAVWELSNTWEGNRIIASLRKEGDEERLTEFEFDAKGDRIVQREMRNGVMERIVRTSGKSETEELFMNGSLVLRAVWEDGRKISEERIRQ